MVTALPTAAAPTEARTQPTPAPLSAASLLPAHSLPVALHSRQQPAALPPQAATPTRPHQSSPDHAPRPRYSQPRVPASSSSPARWSRRTSPWSFLLPLSSVGVSVTLQAFPASGSRGCKLLGAPVEPASCQMRAAAPPPLETFQGLRSTDLSHGSQGPRASMDGAPA